MISRGFKFLLFLIIGISYGNSDQDLVRISRAAFDARWSAKNDAEAVELFREGFQGLSDESKLKAIILTLYEIDLEPVWSMKSEIVMGPQYALSGDPSFISDWDFLRNALSKEYDPRKFYILSKLVPKLKDKEKHDFVFEHSHMLFEDGRVAKEEGEYTKSYAHDVSVYAYRAVLNNLKRLGADFVPPSKDLPHEEQALILAKWLKENWPRCENIKIPSRLSGEENRTRKSLAERVEDSASIEKSSKVKSQQNEFDSDEQKSNLPEIVAGILFLVIIVLFFYFSKRGKTVCQ